jgi:hypothetical protein
MSEMPVHGSVLTIIDMKARRNMIRLRCRA